MNGFSWPLLEGDALVETFVLRDAPPPWVLWLVVAPAIVAFSWWSYRLSGDAPPHVRAALTLLRTLALGFIALMTMNPSRETQIVERQKTLAVVLVDVSASMDRKDGYETSPELADALTAAAGLRAGEVVADLSRLELVKRVLDAPDRKFLDALAEKHDVRVYTFGEGLQSAPPIAELSPRDRVTALGAAIERILEEPEVKSRATGGVVVVTDGKNTAGTIPEAAAEAAARRKIPIHTIGVGDPRALRDVELLTLRADSVVLLDDEIVLDLKVRNRGFPAQPVEVAISDVATGATFFRSTQTLLASEEDQLFRVRHRPNREGEQQWRVEVRPLPGEHSTENNHKIHEVRVRRHKLRVLYVDKFPRWDYRKLKNFLVRGYESFDAQCLLISAEAAFIQEASEGMPPLAQFPTDEQSLFQYDVVILGDVDPRDLENFSPERGKVLKSLRRFVELGGGLAFLSGENYMPRAYKDTPLEDVLPVVVDPTDVGRDERDILETFKPKLTALGRQHPIMALTGDSDQSAALWESNDGPLRDGDVSVPPLDGWYWFARVKKEKPGARSLLVHPFERNEQGPYTLMTAGSFGDGPVFFCGVDEVWRWFRGHGPKYSHQFWGNLVRWLGRTKLYAGDKRFQLNVNRSAFEVGDRVTLTAYVKDRDYRRSTKPEQEIVLRTPSTTEPEKRLLLKKVDDGVFERSLVAQDVGDYQAWIIPEDSVSDEKISPVSFGVRHSDVERREPILDEATLKLVAQKSGGVYRRLPEIRAVLDEIGAETVEIPRRREFRDLRQDGRLPLLLLALLTAEWLVRKRFRYL
jgi:hypothetical protein